MITASLLALATHRPLTPTPLLSQEGCRASASTASPLPRPALPSYTPLRLGAVAPSGWLLEQLLLQANSLSGYMPTSTFPGAKAVNQSVWSNRSAPLTLGADQWLPYWMNGNVPLLALLRAANASSRLEGAARLEPTVRAIVEYVLAHANRTSGWLGPMANEPGDVNGHGLWDPLNMLRALAMYAEAEPAYARRVARAVLAHLRAEYALLRTDPVYKWASTRWPTFVQCALYAVDTLLPRWGDDAEVVPLGADATRELLMNASRLFEAKGMDWYAYYSRTGAVRFPLGPVPNWNVNDHGVNNAEGALAWPAMAYRLWGNVTKGREDMSLVLQMIDTYQAQPNALLCADEVFCGRAPHRGTETCAVVEAMASLEQAFAVLGTPELFDRVEALAFNALPAALTADMWTHVRSISRLCCLAQYDIVSATLQVYVQQANSVFAGRSPSSVEGRAHRHRHLRACTAEEARAKKGDCAPLHDVPSDEDFNSNFFGVSHFPCCITNFPQGWPKFAASAVFASATDNSFVVASLVPLRATLPPHIGGGAVLTTASRYPFGDDALLTVQVPHGHSTTALVRIPTWADRATLNGSPAANGTLVAVPCAQGTTEITLSLHPAVRVTRGWGVHQGPTIRAVVPSEEGPTARVGVPATAQEDWVLSDGATLVPSRAAGGEDVRTGAPHQVALAANAHLIFGNGHYLSSVAVGFTYVSGYTPPAGQVKRGSNVTLHALDAETSADLGVLWRSPELSNYSFDDFHGYSKPVNGSSTGLKIPNSRPIRLALKVYNNERNLQLRLADLTLSVRWSSEVGPEPPVPPANQTSPAADAATVRRGALLYALRPRSRTTVVKRYDDLLPDRPKAVDYEIDATFERWNYALALDTPSLLYNATPASDWSTAMPFDTESYPSSIAAKARQVGAWGFWKTSKITAQPPHSPVDCSKNSSQCGDVESITLVPFGATNVRISVFPWFEG